MVQLSFFPYIWFLSSLRKYPERSFLEKGNYSFNQIQWSSLETIYLSDPDKKQRCPDEKNGLRRNLNRRQDIEYGRREYLDGLLRKKDNGRVKVITGTRRV